MGKSYDAPDFDELARVSERAIDVAQDLGQQQIDFTQEQYADLLPYVQEAADASIGIMNQQVEQGDAYFGHWQDNFRPLEQQMVADAANFNTEAYREGLAAQAAADSARAFSTMQGASDRNMRSMGVNPNSGRFASSNRVAGLAAAADRADAMNDTRFQAQQVGWARGLDAAGLGRGLAGASAAAYGGAAAAGQGAGAGFTNALGTAQQGLNYGAGTVNQGFSTGVGGYSNMVGSQASYAQGMNDSGLEVMGTIGGAALTKW